MMIHASFGHNKVMVWQKDINGAAIRY